MREQKKPELSIRGLMLDPARLTERYAFYVNLLPLLAEWGYNTLWWHFCDDEGVALELDAFPEGASPYALSKKQTENLITKAADVGIHVVPEVETLGHSLWITGNPRFQYLFDGFPYGHNAICPSHPDTMDVLRPIIEEVAKLFPSEYFHAGLDEAVFKDCPRCSSRGEGRPGWWVFAEHVNAVHQTVTSLGKTMIMWADGVEKHPELLDILPRDIVMAHWHYGAIPEEKIWPTAKAGFKMICVPAFLGMIQPAPENFRNINGMIELASRIGNVTCLGVVSALWESFRVIRDTVFPAIAVAGQGMRSGSPVDPSTAIADYAVGVFGLSEKRMAAAVWESMSCTVSLNEFQFLYADSIADIVKSLRFFEEANVADRLARTVGIFRELQELRAVITKNAESFEAHLIAFRISMVALQVASRLREAFAYYCQAEQKAGYAGPDVDVLQRLNEMVGVLSRVRDDIAEITAETSREWDRTRYADDTKKDNSSPAIRQRGRKALLANMMRSERFFIRFVSNLSRDIADFASGGVFPGGI